MKSTASLLLLSPIFFSSCAQEPKSINNQTSEPTKQLTDSKQETVEEIAIIQPSGTTLESRILPPKGYERKNESENSYASYLRQLPLKKHGSDVLTYDGDVIYNDNGYVAVIDLDIGKKDLHQCADAVMRLRAEYLWKQKRYEDIHFNFTNGFRVDYTPWMQGKRIGIKGNRTYWYEKTSASNTYQDFWNYLEIIFSYAGTLSLSKELKSIEAKNMQIGDVFIQGGSPGHAILVMDMVRHPQTGEKLFLLAQSFMPAQETHVLVNPNNDKLSPWYALSELGSSLSTPDWEFYSDQLMRFED